MEAGRQIIEPADISAAMDWWREAGVDCAFEDAPHQWIVAPVAQDLGAGDANDFSSAKTPKPAPPPPRAVIGGDRANWPTQLAGFAEWWLNEPSLDSGQSRGRVPPRGPASASLMVLVAEPEAQDSETLLSGPQGRLLAAMLAAMGVDAAEVYFASALPRHTPMADWADLAVQGLDAALRHHVALVRPQRLIAFGRHIPPLIAPSGLESPLAGNAPPQTSPNFSVITHEGGSVPLLAARDLGSLLDRPIAKGHFWQHWLEWTAG